MNRLGRKAIRIVRRARAGSFERVAKGVVAVVTDILAVCIGQQRYVAVAIVAVEDGALVGRARENTTHATVAVDLSGDLVGVVENATLLNHVEAVEYERSDRPRRRY